MRTAAEERGRLFADLAHARDLLMPRHVSDEDLTYVTELLYDLGWRRSG